jgi:hypothetical protein
MGAYLRAARRRRRVSIERAAEETRIRANFLMRMESDEFDFLAPAYARGFLRSYARYLGLDPDPLTTEFDRRYGIERLDTAQVMALQRRMKHRIPRQPIRLSRAAVVLMVVAGGLAVLAGVGLLFDPEKQASVDEPEVAGPITESPAPTPSPTPSPSPSPTDVVGGIAFTEGIDVQLVASDDCWTQVYADGSPDPVFTGTLAPGESQSFVADEEMTMILGFPEGVDLIVNGHDLGPPGGVNPITITLPDDLESLL